MRGGEGRGGESDGVIRDEGREGRGESDEG